ncbi:hypothetical protein FJT64_016205 [Amphibalanus amphitrite]|uniref:Uncharacterized protein n=2 Tax=Amphibalanus amphitrite TaxID=1232801 RepID=A0A6A4XFD8_AMPAM|nr:hypothetical protein FJT64_016205 [Amphibalanus amphitrite]
MPDVGLIVGASLMGVGGLSVLYGTIMCYKSPNQYYNKEDMEAMVAATVLAEKTSQEKNDKYFDDPIEKDVAQKKRKVLSS